MIVLPLVLPGGLPKNLSETDLILLAHEILYAFFYPLHNIGFPLYHELPEANFLEQPP